LHPKNVQMTAYRESNISEVEVVFSRLPRRPMLAPVTPTSEMPLTVLDEARRMAMPTEVDATFLAEPDDEDEEEVATVPLREAFDVEALRETSPAWTEPMPSPVNPYVVSRTVPLARRVLDEAEQIAATLRASRALPQISPRAPRLEAVPYHELRQPPPTWPPPAPIVIVPPARSARVEKRSEKASVVAALLVSAVALVAGAGTLLYAIAL
jgi:hypothetical protein